MTDADRIVEDYFKIWNEADERRRRDLIAKTWTEGARYLDPVMAGEGHDGIDKMIAGARTQFPGHVFRKVGGVDAHNGRLRFSWALVGPDGSDAGIAGTDFAVVTDDGHLAAITGFFDRLPTA